MVVLDLIRSQLSHFKDALELRVRLAGPAIELNASAAQTIGMAVHELATNASKYGALSARRSRPLRPVEAAGASLR